MKKNWEAHKPTFFDIICKLCFKLIISAIAFWISDIFENFSNNCNLLSISIWSTIKVFHYYVTISVYPEIYQWSLKIDKTSKFHKTQFENHFRRVISKHLLLRYMRHLSDQRFSIKIKAASIKIEFTSIKIKASSAKIQASLIKIDASSVKTKYSLLRSNLSLLRLQLFNFCQFTKLESIFADYRGNLK